MKRLLFILLGCLFLTACDPLFVEKQSEAAKECWFAALDSVEAGRFDLTEQYLLQGIELVGAPAKRIVIKPIIDPITKVQYIVVGDKFKNGKLIVIGTTDFNTLLKYKQIATQYNTDNQNLSKENQIIQNQLKINDQVQNELLKSNQAKDKEIARCHGMIGYKIEQFIINLMSWSKWVLPIGIIALVALCIYNPLILPTLLSIGGIIIGILVKIGNIFLEIISNFLSIFTSKTTT